MILRPLALVVPGAVVALGCLASWNAPPAAPAPPSAPSTAPPSATPAPAASAKEFRLDRVHSKALFRVQHMGAGAFWGRFNVVEGTITHDDAAASPLQVTVSIPVESVDTGSEKLNGHLKSADFFDAEHFPALAFKTTGSRKTADHMYEVTGDLTMRGVTKQVTVPVEWIGTADGRAGRRGGFEAVFTVNRNDYNISYGPGALGDNVRLIVAMEGISGGPPGEGGPERGARGGDRGDPAAQFAALDVNGDGKLQKDEISQRMRGRFEQIDTNGDGVIDLAEFTAARPPGPPGPPGSPGGPGAPGAPGTPGTPGKGSGGAP
jgi:polyisoprenoid-binding protein YceI